MKTRVFLATLAALFLPTLLQAAKPPNDNAAKAKALTGISGTVASTNAEATSEGQRDEPYDYGAGKSVWYSFIAPETGWLEVTYDQSNSIGSSMLLYAFVDEGGYYRNLKGIGRMAGLTYITTYPCPKGSVRKLMFDDSSSISSGGTFNFSYRFVTGSAFKLEGAQHDYYGTPRFSFRENEAFMFVDVVRTGSTDGTSTVDYALVDDTGSTADDLLATGSAFTGTLTFAPGEGRKRLSFDIKNDSLVEPTETFTLQLSNPSTGAIVLAPSASLELEDDDNNVPNDNFANAIVLSGNSDVKDLNDTQLAVTTEAGEPPALDRTLWYRWTAPSDGVVSIDLSGRSRVRVALFTGATLPTLTQVRAVDVANLPTSISAIGTDDRHDLNKNVVTSQFVVQNGVTYSIAVSGFDVSLNTFAGPAITLTHHSVNATVNSLTEAAVSLKQDSYSALESSGKVTLTLTRKGNTTGATPVIVTASQTDSDPEDANYFDLENTIFATPVTDYDTFNNVVTFSAGETEKQVDITLHPNTKKNATRHFYVRLKQQTGTNSPVDAYDHAIVYIVDAKKLSPVTFYDGSYGGTLTPGSGFTSQGTISIKLTATGSFTGSLILNGKKTPLAGSFPPFPFDGYVGSLDTTLNLTPVGSAPITVALHQVREAIGNRAISATVTIGGNSATSTLSAANFFGKYNPLPVVGKFTIELTPDANVPAAIAQPGFLALEIKPAGTFKMMGGLPDGTKVVGSGFTTARFTQNGNDRIYGAEFNIPLYKGTGYLSGSLHLTFPGDSVATPLTGDGTGTVRWVHPALTKGTVLTAFAANPVPHISRYTVPKGALALPGTGPLGLTLDLTGAGLPAANFTPTLTEKNAITFTPGTAGKPSVALIAKTGLFSGKFTPVGATKPLPFQGVIIRNHSQGTGYFLNGTTAGKVKISAP